MSPGDPGAGSREPALDERARLFAALELPAELLRTLLAWRDPLIAHERALRPVPPTSLHITLCFLGWQPVAEIDAIADACAVVDGLPGAGLTVGEAVWLPARQPRVLALRCGDETGQLGAVQATLAGALAAGGWYRPEKRPFLPHVTVARVRRGGPPGRRTAPAPPAHAFRGSIITLFRSRLSAAGASYEPLRSVELRA